MAPWRRGNLFYVADSRLRAACTPLLSRFVPFRFRSCCVGVLRARLRFVPRCPAYTKTVRSTTFDDLFLVSAVNCRFGKVRESCQVAANLCALAMHDKTHETCKFFIDTAAAILLTNNG